MRGALKRFHTTSFFRAYYAAGLLAAASPGLIYTGWPGAASGLATISLQFLVHLPYVLYVQGYNGKLSPRHELVVNLQVIAFLFVAAQVIAFVCFLISKLISET